MTNEQTSVTTAIAKELVATIQHHQIKATVDEGRVCDRCPRPLRSGQWFVDAACPGYAGQWMWLCEVCAKREGVRMGTGLGQKYDSATSVKIEG